MKCKYIRVNEKTNPPMPIKQSEEAVCFYPVKVIMLTYK